jgi:tRNA U34 5-carboxymethylaminomethyl modifying enzyme MnmG/GidA
LQLLGFETDRLKTGTPPRIDRRTVDFSGLEPQHGDEEVCILLAVKLPSLFPLGFLHSAKFSAYID